MRFLRQKTTGFVGQIDQDRAGFENGNLFTAGTVTVDDSGHFIIRADLQKLGLELIAFLNIDRVNGMFQPAFPQHDMNFVPVWCRPGIDIDHEIFSG